MNSCCSFLWILLALLQQFLASDVYLDANGVDHPSCLHGIGACKTFEFLANYSSFLSNHTVCINSSVMYLTNHVVFSNMENVGFVGSRDGTLLSCPTGQNADAGIHFYSSQRIALIGFSVQGCSAMKAGDNISAAIWFDSCQNVTIRGVNISESRSYGVVFTCTNLVGHIHIKNSSFLYNGNSSLSTRSEQNFVSGGVYISVSNSSYADYVIDNCHFLNNTAILQQTQSEDSQTGGGLKISFLDNTTSNTIEVTNCSFVNNSAHHGGGVHFLFSTGSFSNTIQVQNTQFITNTALQMGGGVDAAYLRVSSCNSDCSPDYCNLYFTNCTFTKNVAVSGGGVSIYGTMDTTNSLQNEISFNGFKLDWQCSFERVSHRCEH